MKVNRLDTVRLKLEEKGWGKHQSVCCQRPDVYLSVMCRELKRKVK